MKFTYNGEELHIVKRPYAMGGSMRIDVEDAAGFPYCTLSTNLPGEPIPDGRFWLKDWSENFDIVAHLIREGIIEIDESVAAVPSGFVMVRAARLQQESEVNEAS